MRILRPLYTVRRILIEVGGADITAANRKEQTPLHKACELNRWSIVAILLEAAKRTLDLASLEQWIMHHDLDGNTAMILAVKKRAEKTAEIMLQEGIDANHCNERRESALHCACAEGVAAIVKTLIKAITRSEQHM